MVHTFHIPVLGLAFSIDSPLKVAQYGISSAVSIVDDNLTERLREYHSKQNDIHFELIKKNEHDARAKRITAYLNMMQDIIDKQINDLKESSFDNNESLHQYFNLLPVKHPAYNLYLDYLITSDSSKKNKLEICLKNMIEPGDINVNIMSKVDKVNRDEEGNLLDRKFSDATAALRGFANSKIKSTLVLSAGMNPKLYNYLAVLSVFFPNEQGELSKKVCLKVSDYRSAYIQAKYLAKKGIWVSEFRVESGLNCGGHAFATEGFLLGPILEEFKDNRNSLRQELFNIYQEALVAKNIILTDSPAQIISAQGGVGTGNEQKFLLDYYKLDSIGWGSPFLLVPEATTVDDQTLQALATADKDDFYLSDSSPLGVPLHNFRKSTAEAQRMERIDKGRAGAPCTKKYLVSNDDFSSEPICTASRVYQNTKLKELELLQELNFIDSSAENIEKLKKEITSKTCLCEGLAASAYLKYDIAKRKENTAVSICPGPNTAYFNRTYSLSEMVSHIYRRIDLLKDVDRPSIFINEIRLYIDYLEKFIVSNPIPDEKQKDYIHSFHNQLLNGMNYYKDLANKILQEEENRRDFFLSELEIEKQKLSSILS